MLDPHIEALSPTKLRELQEDRFRKIVRYAADRVPLIRNRFKEKGLSADAVTSLDDAAKVPFTEKDDLRATYPYGLLAVPLDEIVEFHASSGTTGKPTVVAYTKRDRETWTHLMARCYAAAGAEKGDVVHVAREGLFHPHGRRKPSDGPSAGAARHFVKPFAFPA